jgi:hypothetical protein
MPSNNRADYGPKNNSGGSDRSVTVNGRVVTDPQRVAQIERNREGAARYAVDAYQKEGTPIPSHLRGTVEAQIARGDYGGGGAQRNTGGTGSFGLPDPMSGGKVSRIAGLRIGSQTGGDGGGGGMISRITGGYTGLTDMINGGGPGAAAQRQAPTPGPNYFAGLGAPGTPTDRGGQGFAAMIAPAAPVVSAPPSDSMDSGNEDGEEVSRRNAERSRVPTYAAGGYVGKGGVPQRPSTASLDLPPALARMLAMPTQSYAEGGMVGPGGVPQRPMTSPMAMNLAQQGGAPVVGVAPPGQQGRPLNFAAIDQQAQQFMQQNPQQVQQIRAQVEESMASGEIDAQSLNMFVQIATTALQSPEMWPQLRQVLIRQGMLDAEEVSEEYDQGFLIVLYIIGKTMGSGRPTTPAPMSAGQSPQMSMKKGGALPAKSANPDGSIPINAHEGEYVIPADVTRKLGTNHFDKLIAKARGVDMNGNGGSTSSMNGNGGSTGSMNDEGES